MKNNYCSVCMQHRESSHDQNGKLEEAQKMRCSINIKTFSSNLGNGIGYT